MGRGTVNEHPVFIPFRDERLAGIVTLPDEVPRGLVLLLQGMGAPRSHKYRLWTRTARLLAERGFASLRFDYEELGDSTGSFTSHLDDPPLEEAITATTFVMRALGVKSVVAVGNCMGARAALALGNRMQECTAVVCILPGNLEAILLNDPKVGIAETDGSFSRPDATTTGSSTSATPTPVYVPDFLATVDRADTLLVYLGSDAPFRRLARIVASLPDSSKRKEGTVRTMLLPMNSITQFRLTMTMQPLLIDAIVDWIDARPAADTGALPVRADTVDSRSDA
jgi:pimeloyl-ACP methyl ester carboxylesterase